MSAAGRIVAGVFALVFVAPPARAADVDRCVDAATLGQSERDRGHLTSAYRELVACSQPTCPGPVASACTGWLAEVERRIPTVVFRVHDGAGIDIADVAVLLDGATVLPKLTGRPTPLDPGAHRFRFERADGTSVERDILLAEGEKNRLLVVAWPSPPPVKPATAPASRGLPPAFWILGVTGGVALGTASVLGLVGMGDARSLRRSCGPRCPEDERDGVARTLLAADIALGIGVVTLGIATWIALTHDRSPQSASITTSSKTMSIP